MRIATPRMGNLSLIVQDLAMRFGLDYIETPPFSEETVEMGAALAPEFACLPLKAVLGSFVQVLDMGADTLVMGGGSGPCRFGYYAEIQRRILEREGREFRMVVFDPPAQSLPGFYRNLRYILPAGRARPASLLREITRAIRKVVVFDEVEKWALALRGIEAVKGSVDAALAEARSLLACAFTKKEIEAARAGSQELFRDIAVDTDGSHLRVGLVGEIFVVLEPYFNFDIDTWLGKRGVSVERAVHVTDTIYPLGRNPVFGFNERQVEKAAAPFLSHEVGGDGLLSVGASVIFAQRGFDAVIHFLPFTCMPEVIAKSVLSRVSSELDIPVLSLTIDEQTGRAGIETRLEALLDLAKARMRRKKDEGPGDLLHRGLTPLQHFDALEERRAG